MKATSVLNIGRGSIGLSYLKRTVSSVVVAALTDQLKTDGGLSVAVLVVLQVCASLLRNALVNGVGLQVSHGPWKSRSFVLLELLKSVIALSLLYRSRWTRSGPNSEDIPFTPLPVNRASRFARKSRRFSELDGYEKGSQPSGVSSPAGRSMSQTRQRRSSSISSSITNHGFQTPETSNTHTQPRVFSWEVPLEDNMIGREQDSDTRLNKRLIYQLLVLAVLYASRNYVRVAQNMLADETTVYIVSLSVVIFVGIQSPLFRCSIEGSQWMPALLMVCSLVMSQLPMSSELPKFNTALLLLSSWLSSLLLLFTHRIYKSNNKIPIHKINAVLFTFTFAAHLLGLLLHIAEFHNVTPLLSQRAPMPYLSGDLRTISLLLLEAFSDIISLSVIRDTSAFTFCTASMFSSLLVYLLSPAITDHFGDWTFQQISSITLGLYAAWTYWNNSQQPEERDNSIDMSSGITRSGDLSSPIQTSPSNSGTPRSSRSALTVLVLFAIMIGFTLITSEPHMLPQSFAWTATILGTQAVFTVPLPRALTAQCVRNPLPPSSNYTGTGERGFHAFDDVLAVVFFSHARYDANLDYYRQAYSKYFPNILFIGPASREDKGFLHSYDVVVDSYQSDEDFGDWFKMAGRMAHHMLYTAVKDHPCYAGYLFAPFDAFLNVPRLAQFPQDQIWYHSPFGVHVDNPAIVDTADYSMHPPAANVSADTPKGYSEKFHPFGQEEWHWWWGEPHVGLEVCQRAYDRLPMELTARMERLTGEPNRYIGGSADTLYFPGHLRDSFLEVLGLFLETDCFLEIALPTALHLIKPQDESIAFVDHWWIWDPPLNTTFVRNKWAQGYEVDSFHTFHWGDKGDDGIWRAHVNSVQDVRDLLKDSFIRQGMPVP